jgi:hypothetical protein
LIRWLDNAVAPPSPLKGKASAADEHGQTLQGMNLVLLKGRCVVAPAMMQCKHRVRDLPLPHLQQRA